MLIYSCFFNTVYRITLKHWKKIVPEIFRGILNLEPDVRYIEVNVYYETGKCFLTYCRDPLNQIQEQQHKNRLCIRVC